MGALALAQQDQALAHDDDADTYARTGVVHGDGSLD